MKVGTYLPWGGGAEEPLLEGVLFLMRLLLLAFNRHSRGTSWVPGPVPQDVLGLNR